MSGPCVNHGAQRPFFLLLASCTQVMSRASLISDGGDNASTHSLAQVLKIVGQSSALVYTIGIFDEEDPDRNPGVLNRLARAT
ncbi:MAG: hypothetical protein ACKV22_35270, partial [Bryobacteraceae bacterium]